MNQIKIANPSAVPSFHRAVAALCLLLGLSPLTVMADCKGIALHAHRGDSSSPENSASSARSGLQGEWDGIEIDLQQLRDGSWVLHHDPLLGRTTSLARTRVQALDSSTWREVLLKDRKGHVSTERAPFLSDILALAKERPEKVVNAEIKQEFSSCDVAKSAVAQFANASLDGQWFLTSISRRHLQCARRYDPSGYLGQIVLDAQALAQQDPRTASRASRLAPPKIDRAWLSTFLKEVSGPAGIHVDTNTLEANPGLLADARELGVIVFSYNLKNDREHLKGLRRVAQRTGLWPSGAIIDGAAAAFCAELTK